MNSLIIDSNDRVNPHSLSHDFKVRFEHPIKVSKFICLKHVHIPFTQNAIRHKKYPMFDMSYQVANGSFDNDFKNISFIVKPTSVSNLNDAVTINLSDFANKYFQPADLVTTVNDQLQQANWVEEYKLQSPFISALPTFAYDETRNKYYFKFASSLSKYGISLIVTDPQSDLHQVLGIGSKRNEWYQTQVLNPGAGIDRLYFQQEVNMNTIPSVNIFIPQFHSDDLRYSDKYVQSNFNVPVTCNRRELIKQVLSHNDTYRKCLQGEFYELDIKLYYNDNIPFDINDSRVQLSFTYY